MEGGRGREAEDDEQDENNREAVQMRGRMVFMSFIVIRTSKTCKE
jgi:hypothetical protein